MGMRAGGYLRVLGVGEGGGVHGHVEVLGHHELQPERVGLSPNAGTRGGRGQEFTPHFPTIPHPSPLPPIPPCPLIACGILTRCMLAQLPFGRI